MATRRLSTQVTGASRLLAPHKLDCAFESICETCSYFQTSIEFRPTLQAQHHDAATKNQADRAALFDSLINRIDRDQAS